MKAYQHFLLFVFLLCSAAPVMQKSRSLGIGTKSSGLCICRLHITVLMIGESAEKRRVHIWNQRGSPRGLGWHFNAKSPQARS